jgi:hypothetical protein
MAPDHVAIAVNEELGEIPLDRLGTENAGRRAFQVSILLPATADLFGFRAVGDD